MKSANWISNMASSNVFLCPTKRSKPKDIQLTAINDKEDRQISYIWKAGTRDFWEILVEYLLFSHVIA